MGDIIFTRPSGNYMKNFDYNIYINGELKSKIRNQSRKVISLKPGKYEIMLKVMGQKSNTLNLELKSKETLRLTIENRFEGIKYLFSAFYIFSKKSKLILKETII